MRWLRSPSLGARLVLLILLAVVPVLALTLYTNAELRRLTAADEKKETLRLARIAASDQADAVKDTRRLLSTLAQLPELLNADLDACPEYFARSLSQYPQYVHLGALDQDGSLRCSVPATDGTVDLTGLSSFQRALQTRDFAIGDYRVDSIAGRATLDFGYPVFDEAGQPTTVIFASLDLIWLSQLAAEAQLPEGSTFTVFDRNGTILSRYPDPERWVGESGMEAAITEAVLGRQGEGTVETKGLDGTPRLFAFAPLPGVPGGDDVYVTVGIPAVAVYANADRLLARNLAVLGLVTVVAFAAAWLGVRLSVLRWVTGLLEATRKLAAGDLTARTGLPHREGELSQLARGLDEMAGSLERRVAERDQAEAALHESQRALSTLMSNLPGMAYRRRHDRQWTMEYVSEGGRQLTGYDPRALAQNAAPTYGDLIHSEDLDPLWAEVEAALEQRRPFEVSYRISTAEQDWKWVLEKGQGVFSDDGRLVAVEGFVSDITERVLAQQTLERKVADRTRELAALYDVMAVVNASVGLDTILENALDRVLAVMRVATGAIHLLDESGEVLSLATCRGAPGEAMAPYRRLPIEGSLAGRVVARGEPVVATEPGPHTTDIAFPTTEQQVYAGVPMRARGHILGVLSLAGEAGRCFSDDEIALLGLIAEELAVAVENARLHQQARQVAVVRERERLARDLHDSVTQSLYSLTLLAEAARRLAGGAQIGRVQAHLERVVEISQQALREMRLLVYELRPLVLRREGLIGALQQRLDAVEKRAGIDARLIVQGETDLPVHIEDAFYRIAQEALNNVLKHARADTITVKVCAVEGSAMVEIADDGAGFDEGSIADTGGLGLANMRQRAEEVGASLLIGSTPGGGTRVRVSVTLDESHTGAPTREVA